MLKKAISAFNGIIDTIPAISGLIGKVSLVSSFAIIWANELNINTPNFVYENVRLEIFFSSIITLFTSFFLRNILPAGTLAPLIIYIPTMARLGVHPLILNLFIGLIGIICVKTKLFDKMLAFSSETARTCLTLIFGLSGVMLVGKNLLAFFADNILHLTILLVVLSLLYVLFIYHNKPWLIIPIAAIVSLIYSQLVGVNLLTASAIKPVILNPYKWWGDIWGIAFSFDLVSVFITIPFAMFTVLLIAIDTASVQMVIKDNTDKINENADNRYSFIFLFIRNIIGSIFGGVQTAALWRSFLIPLYSMKRPLFKASFILGIIGIYSSVTETPIKIFSYPPLVWTVLLFGVFLPFVNRGLINTKNSTNNNRIIIALTAFIGVLLNPILSWLFVVVYEKLTVRNDKRQL